MIAATRSRDDVPAIALGLLFFLAHLGLAVASVRSADTRDRRLEAWGLLVRGLPGLMLAAAVALRASRVFSLILLLAAIPTLIVGRAVYELVAFRDRSAR